MKKSSLTTAVLAGLAGLVGFAGSAGAVDLNPDGTGQVLIYPYYTVQAGQQTYVSVVNSTDVAKAVKVRFIESYNSREVLDFNLFLSPYDVWTGTIFALSDAGLTGDGAAFGTSDNSCTVPSFANLSTSVGNLHYQPFSNSEFSGAKSDGGPTDVSRTREGYVELIQMADIADNNGTATAVTHVQPAGVPAGCGSSLLRDTGNTDFVAPTGGLFGAGQIIDVANGTLYSYNADAIQGFSITPLFRDSGSLDPNLSAANTDLAGNATANVFQGTGVVSATYPPASAIDAVSAVFDASSLMNEWISNASGGQGTDWVVTFPTKRFYVDPQTNPAAPVQPFPEAFVDGTACTQVEVGTGHMFNREELTTTTTTNDDFSPRPPGIPPKSLCYEVNVISFSDASNAVSVLGAANPLNLNTAGFATAGWLKLGLNPVAETHQMRTSTNGITFFGLPATGFSAQRYINANAQPGTLANYAGAFRHRVERDISAVQVP
ncbi:MAG: hypothetical protein WBW92_09950 [Rhodanobacteraceae bacterium]